MGQLTIGATFTVLIAFTGNYHHPKLFELTPTIGLDSAIFQLLPILKFILFLLI
jgi:hypothetical protein